MTAKRDRLGIIHDILRIIERKGQIKPTQVMYQANLSHEMLNDYMNELLSKGFITEEIQKNGRRIYSLTEKGIGYLKEYATIKGFLESYGLV